MNEIFKNYIFQFSPFYFKKENENYFFYLKNLIFKHGGNISENIFTLKKNNSLNKKEIKNLKYLEKKEKLKKQKKKKNFESNEKEEIKNEIKNEKEEIKKYKNKKLYKFKLIKEDLKIIRHKNKKEKKS
jgi:hypothetical protein